ncbi:CinA family protein [Pontiellaceae bacterium B12219]|nr:CinA family protein [Pontiellaceae bacterium B12219]
MNDTAEQIRTLLFDAGKTVCTAESITAGHLQTMLASVSGASDVFKGGITAYKLSIKSEVLGVDADLGCKTDCVDPEVARQMAKGALAVFKSDYAIATCGYAEKYAERSIDAPFAYFAIAEKGDADVFCIKSELSGDRIAAQKQAAEKVLAEFLKLLRHKVG